MQFMRFSRRIYVRSDGGHGGSKREAVAQWKLETEDRLLGQYDITSIAGREVPCLMLSNLLAILDEAHSDESDSEQRRSAEVARRPP